MSDQGLSRRSFLKWSGLVAQEHLLACVPHQSPVRKYQGTSYRVDFPSQ